MVTLGVPGFKCFLIRSGVDEFPAVTRDQVDFEQYEPLFLVKDENISNAKQSAQAREALVQLRGTGATLLFHAECELEDEEDLVLSNIHIITCLGLPCSRWPTSCSPGW